MNPQSYYGGNMIVPQNKPSFFRSKTGLMLMALAVLLVSAIVLGVVSTTSSTPEDKFMELAFAKHEPESSYRLLGPGVTEEMSLTAWQKKIEKYKETYTEYAKESSVESENQVDELAYKHVIYTLTAKEEKDNTIITLEYRKKLGSSEDFVMQAYTIRNNDVTNSQ